MTISRAIVMLQNFIDFKLIAAVMMRKNAAEGSLGGLAKQAADLHDKERGMLEQILKELKPETKKTFKIRDPTIKDMITKQVRVQVVKELKKSKPKHDARRKKKIKGNFIQ